jgi:hypothetical protein
VPTDGQKVSKRSGSNCAILKSGSFATITASASSGRTWCRQKLNAPVDFYEVYLNAVKTIAFNISAEIGGVAGLEMSSQTLL